jgi:hypothetical protein
LPCWITMAGIRKNTLGICNAYSFYWATVVTRTRLNITFIVHTLQFMFLISIIPPLLFSHLHTSVTLIGRTNRTIPGNLQKSKVASEIGELRRKKDCLAYFILLLTLKRQFNPICKSQLAELFCGVFKFCA